jgi:hypothetical protein
MWRPQPPLPAVRVERGWLSPELVASTDMLDSIMGLATPDDHFSFLSTHFKEEQVHPPHSQELAKVV